VSHLVAVLILVGKNTDQRTWDEHTHHPQNGNPFETFIHASSRYFMPKFLS
jgi:hypothetical protein